MQLSVSISLHKHGMLYSVSGRIHVASLPGFTYRINLHSDQSKKCTKMRSLFRLV